LFLSSFLLLFVSPLVCCFVFPFSVSIFHCFLPCSFISGLWTRVRMSANTLHRQWQNSCPSSVRIKI
jgi:hypothetical protein